MRLPKINKLTAIAFGISILADIVRGAGDDKKNEEIIRDETRKYLDKHPVEKEEKTE